MTDTSGDVLRHPPQPQPDDDTLAFWQATEAGQLALCRCPACGLWMQPPLERCRRCASPTAFEAVAGTGEVYSFIVQRQPTVPGYVDEVPYAIAVVDLDEQRGLRLPGRLVGVNVDDVRCGMRVRAELRPLPGGDYTVAVFRPA